jgi:hypothetical protein
MACEKFFFNGKWITEAEFKNELKNGLLSDLVNEGKVTLEGYTKKNLTSSQKDVLNLFNDLLEQNKVEPAKTQSDIAYQSFIDKVKRDMVFRDSSIEAAKEAAYNEVIEPYLKDKSEEDKKLLDARVDNFVAHVESVNLGKKPKPTIGVGIKISDNPAFQDIKPTDSADTIKERALKYVMENTKEVENMMFDTIENPRPLTSDEVIQLTGLKALKRKVIKDLYDKLKKLDPKSKDYKDTKREIDQAIKSEEDVLVGIAMASHKTGSEMGQAFALRKLLLTEDFDFAVEAARQEALQGKPLSKAELERLKRLEIKFKNLDERLAEIDAEREKLKAIAIVQDIIDSKDEEEESPTKKTEPYINRKGELIIPRPYILSFIDQGITDAEELFDVMKDDLDSRGINASVRNITDAISNYGKAKTIEPKDREKALAEARRIAGLLSKIDDAKQGILPKKLSKRNTAPRVKERLLRKQLNELMKQFDITDEVNEAKLKTRLQSIKTRLQNNIDEIEHKIDKYNETGVLEDIKTTKSKTELDQAAKDLQDRLKLLKEDLKAIKDSEGISEQEALAEALDRVQKRIDLYDSKIQSGDTSLTKEKEDLFDKTNQEWKDKEDELKQKKKEFDEMRKQDPNWVQSQEAKKLQQSINAMQRANNKLREDLDNAQQTNYASIGYNQKPSKQHTPEQQLLIDERQKLLQERQELRDDLGLTDAERLRKLKERTKQSLEEQKQKLKTIQDLGKESVIGKDTDLKGNPKQDIFHTKEEMDALSKPYNMPDIERALRDGTYEQAIKDGLISSADAIRILESYELNPSRAINKLYREDAKAFNLPKKQQKEIDLDDEARQLKLEKENLKQEQERMLENIEYEKKTFTQKLLNNIGRILQLPRIFQAGGDISGTFIQGAFIVGQLPITLITNRKLALKQLNTIRVAAKLMYATKGRNIEKEYHKYLDSVRENGLYDLAKKAGIRFQGDSIEAEESLSNVYAVNIPIFGDTLSGFSKLKEGRTLNRGLRLSKRSEVSYNIMADMFRMQKFEKYYDSLTKAGIDFNNPEGQKELKAVADVINTYTGSASLSGFENSAKALGALAYSSRMLASKLKVFNIIYYHLQPEAARKVIRTEVMSYIGGQIALQTLIAGGVAAFASANPDDEEDDAEFKARADHDFLIGNSKCYVNYNPFSVDFMKLRAGKETYSIMGGFEQFPRLIAMLVSGKKYNREGYVVALDSYDSQDSWTDLFTKFLLNKTTPVINQFLHYQSLKQNDVKPTGVEMVQESFTPFVAATVYDLISQPYDKNNEEQGNALQLLGIGVKAGIVSLGVQVNVDKEWKKKSVEEKLADKEKAIKEGTYIPSKAQQRYERFLAREKARRGGE